MAINQMTNLTWMLKFEKKKIIIIIELGKQNGNSPKSVRTQPIFI